MALRNNHYDAAFEEFLRGMRTPYVAVDEKRRALAQQASLKSMDFIVYSPRTLNLLIDVKGRTLDSPRSRHRFESWATEDDIRSLLAWEEVFGSAFRALLVFAYAAAGADEPAEARPDEFRYRERRYSFYGVWANDYRDSMRTRSASWETVWLPVQDFRRLRSPITHFL